MIAHIQGTPSRFASLMPIWRSQTSLPIWWRSACEKNPEERPASARHLIRELKLVEKEIARIEKAKQTAPQTPGHHKSPGWKFWKS